MFWRLGWILNSLKYQVDMQLHDWRKTNDVLKRSKWNVIERGVLFFSRRPFIFSGSMLIAMLSLAFVLTYYYSTIIKYIPNFKRQLWLDLDNWDFTIIASSIAIISLIVPLALGFVGNDIKSSSSRDVFWMVFLEYSAAKLLVLSSLFLIIFLLIIQFIEPFSEPKFSISLSIVSIIWMIVNLALMGWFFFATFKLVTSNSRNFLTNRYCINEELVNELRNRLSRLLPQVAVDNKLIPTFSNDEEIKNKLYVSTFHFYDKNKKIYTKVFSNSKYAKNIYFRILSLAIHTINISIKLSDTLNRVFLKNKIIPVKYRLCLPIVSVDVAAIKVIYSEYNGFNLNTLSKFLIRISYDFKNGTGRKESGFKLLISMLTGQVRDAMRDNNYQQYELAVEALEVLTSDLIEGSHFINDDGILDNWLLLSDGSFFGNRLFRVIGREFYELTSESLQLLDKSTKYYERIIRTQRRIFGYRDYSLSSEITNELLDTHYMQWLALTNSKGQLLETESSNFLKMNYLVIVRSYVSSWESWPEFYRGIDNVEWKKSKDVGKFYTEHLNNTACMLVNSLRNKDIESATWATDMLIRWIDNLYIGRTPRNYHWRSDFLTIDKLGKDESDELLTFVFNGDSLNSNTSNQYSDVLKIALLNYWCDVIICTAAYILQRPTDDISSKTINLVTSLIDEKRPYPSGGVEKSNLSLTSGTSFYIAILRQNWLSNKFDYEYKGKLNALVRRFNSLDEVPKVSGRIYSGWGDDGIGNLVGGVKALFLYKIKNQASTNREINDFLNDLAKNDDHRASILSGITKFIEVDSELLTNQLDVDDYSERNKKFIESFGDIANSIEERREEDLLQADVDPEREKQLSRYASRDAFNLLTASFPINQFKKIVEINKDNLKKYTFTYSKYRKSDVAIGMGTTHISNEDDWLADTINSQLSVNIMQQLWAKIKNITYDDDENWLTLLRKINKTIKENEREKYLLIVNQWGLRWYLDKLIYGYDDDIPHAEFECNKQDGMKESYICSFEGIDVHSGPFKDTPNILIPKDYFSLLQVGKSEDNEWVQVKYESDADSENINIGNLVLTYWFTPEFNQRKVYLFKGPENEGN